jgi:parvulin-like peptidyl-prolyl isomerase
LSALEGGNLGWVASQAMSNVILSVVKNMSPGDVSEPIIKSETALFIKLLDKRKVEFSDINLNTMKNKIISQRKNELLNLFSNSYLSKVKNNTLIQYNE